eukprot:scaffold10474_cov122-Isochrysis_galbana.AAC.5
MYAPAEVQCSRCAKPEQSGRSTLAQTRPAPTRMRSVRGAAACCRRNCTVHAVKATAGRSSVHMLSVSLCSRKREVHASRAPN